MLLAERVSYESLRKFLVVVTIRVNKLKLEPPVVELDDMTASPRLTAVLCMVDNDFHLSLLNQSAAGGPWWVSHGTIPTPSPC